MRGLVRHGALLAGLLLASALLTGCCCGERPVTGAPLAQLPPEEPIAPAPMPVVTPPPPPMVTPEPEIVTPPPPPPPIVIPTTEVPAAVAAAIEDLGQKYPGLFTFDRAKGLFRFNSDITFDSGSSVVKPRAKEALMKLADILSGDEAKSRSMTIIGFTDSTRVAKAGTIASLKALGKAPNNQGLSEARAESVAAVLRAGGVTARRVTTRGKGAADPVASNSTPDGRAQNRRVEIYLTPMK